MDLIHEFNPAYADHVADMAFGFELAEDMRADWQRGDATASDVTSALYGIARAAFAAARHMRADDETVTSGGDLFSEDAFAAEFGSGVIDPFETVRAQIGDLPEAGEQ